MDIGMTDRCAFELRAPKFLLILAIALSSAACSLSARGATAESKSPKLSADRQVIDPRTEEYLQQMVMDDHFTGVVLLMMEGAVVHAKGYGNAFGDSANTVATAFHVASITKQFTATAILQLVEQRKIDLDVSVNEYLPPHYRSPRWQGVSVHHLLSHTSGIPDYAVTRDYYHVVKGFCSDETVNGMVREAMAKDLEFEAGTKFSYSNIGFTLLGLVIENQASTPFDEYIKHSVLDPLGMTDSRIHRFEQGPTPDEAEGFRWSDDQNAHVPDDILSLPATVPDGGLVTTVADFARWAEIYMGRAPTILSPESVERMLSPVMATGWAGPDGLPLSIGYGVLLSGELISHPGSIVGFRSHFIVDRKRNMLVAVFANNTSSDPWLIAASILEAVESPVGGK